MRILLVALCLLLAGCGTLNDLQGSATLSNGTVTGSVTATTPFGNITFSPSGVRGDLSFLVTIVDYTDQTNPVSDADAAELLQRVDAFLRRNVGVGIVGRVNRVMLGSTADYIHDAYPEGVVASKLQDAAKAASVGPERFKLFLLPPSPALATGGGFVDGSGGEAFISAWTAWQNLPIPHELGHMLGLPHGPGVMRQGSPFDNDWNGQLPLQ